MRCLLTCSALLLQLSRSSRPPSLIVADIANEVSQRMANAHTAKAPSQFPLSNTTVLSVRWCKNWSGNPDAAQFRCNSVLPFTSLTISRLNFTQGVSRYTHTSTVHNTFPLLKKVLGEWPRSLSLHAGDTPLRI